MHTITTPKKMGEGVSKNDLTFWIFAVGVEKGKWLQHGKTDIHFFLVATFKTLNIDTDVIPFMHSGIKLTLVDFTKKIVMKLETCT